MPRPARHPETLKLRRVAIDTYRENVAYMHRECEFYRAEGFQALTKIEVQANGKRVYAVLNVVDDAAIVDAQELWLSGQPWINWDSRPGNRCASPRRRRPPPWTRYE